ncbi:MAG: hypothetical protein ACR2QT_02415 [Woeseiaceae bacterium]
MTTSRTFVLFTAALVLIGCSETSNQSVVQAPPPSPPVSTPLVINVDASQLDGDFLLAGGAFANSVYQSGDILLREQGTGTLVELGNTYDHAYQVMVVNGMYDSVYQHFNGGAVPANKDGIVTPDLAINVPSSIDIDVPSASIRPVFLLDGNPFPASVYNHASFWLQPVDTDELIFLGDSHVANDIVNVMPGDYHVIYMHEQGAQVPANQHARVMSDISVSGNTALNVDVPSTTARTSFALDGAAFPQSQYDAAKFYLVDGTGDEVFLGNSFDAPASVLVVAGTYSMEYRHQQGSTVPINKAAIVRSGLDCGGGCVASADVQSAALDIVATLNGQPFPASQYQDGNLELFDANTGSYSLLGSTRNPLTGLMVVQGTYDILYSHEDGEAVPQNIRGTVAAGYIIAGGQQLDLDVVGYLLSGSITLDSVAFPQSQYNTADFLLSGTASTEEIFLFASHSQDEPAMVLPGTYDVIYSCHNCIEIPFNSYAPVMSAFEVNADGVIATNLMSARIEASATLNGGAFDASIYQSGLIWGGIGEQDAVELTRTNVATADIILLSGDYNFYYQHQNGDQVPANTWALVDQQAIVAPPN